MKQTWPSGHLCAISDPHTGKDKLFFSELQNSELFPDRRDQNFEMHSKVDFYLHISHKLRFSGGPMSLWLHYINLQELRITDVQHSCLRGRMGRKKPLIILHLIRPDDTLCRDSKLCLCHSLPSLWGQCCCYYTWPIPLVLCQWWELIPFLAMS